MGTGEFNAGVTLRWTPNLGGVELLLVASCYRNQDKLRPDGLLGSNADFTYLYLCPVTECTNMYVK